MNRTIRFRAYDNSWKKKVMIYFGIFDTDEGLYCKDGVTDIRKAEIMQFTGLKDKNGKEIYEGYILKLKSPKIYEVGEPLHFGHFIFTLEQNGTEFGEFDERGEVIGNVFENPNLLKK